ncbi:uncharacterized protein LOC126319871 [Schistocerca gregaria]|uniref:uncharacterized protein LOC126319871 n=1 Tax=Schistocerca gregaria TaxID=7010 RepID=UPI00211E4C0D|nr:uncharacterized protein LOC126319871 [Schistocerca gregaria]XP_049849518.1 uncharacterized protein LOC126319871 [Schistocerca gregaria]XP_049849519.1 uncharacterized protein LOC126319871 [Schistocerca gregaria]XP_049849520.1 uncharacterized protein LOC126319871 [Schistocerca gregaria]
MPALLSRLNDKAAENMPAPGANLFKPKRLDTKFHVQVKPNCMDMLTQPPSPPPFRGSAYSKGRLEELIPYTATNQKKTCLNKLKKVKERDRRDQISQCIFSLRQIIPECQNKKKMSRLSLMLETIDHVKNLENKIYLLCSENQKLKLQNELLKKFVPPNAYHKDSDAMEVFQENEASQSEIAKQTAACMIDAKSQLNKHITSYQTEKGFFSLDLDQKTDNSCSTHQSTSSDSQTESAEMRSPQESKENFVYTDSSYAPADYEYSQTEFSTYQQPPKKYNDLSNNQELAEFNYKSLEPPDFKPNRCFDSESNFNSTHQFIDCRQSYRPTEYTAYPVDTYRPVQLSKNSSEPIPAKSFPNYTQSNSASSGVLECPASFVDGSNYLYSESQLFCSNSTLDNQSCFEQCYCNSTYSNSPKFLHTETGELDKPSKDALKNDGPSCSLLFPQPYSKPDCSQAFHFSDSNESRDECVHNSDFAPNCFIGIHNNKDMLCPQTFEKLIQEPSEHLEWSPEPALIGDIEDLGPWPLYYMSSSSMLANDNVTSAIQGVSEDSPCNSPINESSTDFVELAIDKKPTKLKRKKKVGYI